MKKLFNLLTLAAVGLASTVSAFDFCNCNFKEVRTDLGYSFRQDTVQYDFTNPELFPADISEHVKLDKVGINMFSGALTAITCENVLFRVKGDYGLVKSGTGTRTDIDSQATEIGPRNEWSFEVDDNYVWDISLGLGYDMTFCCDQLHIIPMIGYSWHKQRYLSTDWERRFFDAAPVPENEITGYYERYENRWNGFWVGLDTAYVFCCNWTLFAGFEYHKLCLSGYYFRPPVAAFSIVSPTLSPNGSPQVNMDLESCGQMWNVHAGVNYSFCCNWNMVVAGSWQKWTANNGFSEAFQKGLQASALSDLEVTVKAWTITAAIGYRF
jgi:hypothetical protein